MSLEFYEKPTRTRIPLMNVDEEGRVLYRAVYNLYEPYQLLQTVGSSDFGKACADKHVDAIWAGRLSATRGFGHIVWNEAIAKIRKSHSPYWLVRDTAEKKVHWTTIKVQEAIQNGVATLIWEGSNRDIPIYLLKIR